MAFDEEINSAINRALTALRGKVDRDLGLFGQELFAAMRSTVQAQIDEVREAARAQDPERANVARLLDQIRSLDRARSLSEALDVLAQSACQEVERAAVLVVGGDGFRGWRASGFGVFVADPRSLVVGGDSAGIVSTVRPGVEAGPSVTEEADLPAFARGAGSRYALALPITLDDRVVAVLYADATPDEGAATSRWPAVLDVMAHYTSRVLESLTVRQAVGATLAG